MRTTRRSSSRHRLGRWAVVSTTALSARRPTARRKLRGRRAHSEASAWPRRDRLGRVGQRQDQAQARQVVCVAQRQEIDPGVRATVDAGAGTVKVVDGPRRDRERRSGCSTAVRSSSRRWSGSISDCCWRAGGRPTRRVVQPPHRTRARLEPEPGPRRRRGGQFDRAAAAAPRAHGRFRTRGQVRRPTVRGTRRRPWTLRRDADRRRAGQSCRRRVTLRSSSTCPGPEHRMPLLEQAPRRVHGVLPGVPGPGHDGRHQRTRTRIVCTGQPDHDEPGRRDRFVHDRPNQNTTARRIRWRRPISSVSRGARRLSAKQGAGDYEIAGAFAGRPRRAADYHARAAASLSPCRAWLGRPSIGGSSPASPQTSRRSIATRCRRPPPGPGFRCTSRRTARLATSGCAGSCMPTPADVPGALVGVTEELDFPSSASAGWYDLPFASPAGPPVRRLLARTDLWPAAERRGVCLRPGYWIARDQRESVRGRSDRSVRPIVTDNAQMSLYLVYDVAGP